MRAGNGRNGSCPFEVLPGVCLTVWNVPPGVRYSLDYARKDRSCTVSFFRTGSAVLDMADGQTTRLGPGDVLVASAKNIVLAAQAPGQCHGVTIDLDPVRIENSVRQDAFGLDLSRLAGFAAGCRVPLVMHADAVLSHVCFDLETLQTNGERGTLLYLKSMEVLVLVEKLICDDRHRVDVNADIADRRDRIALQAEAIMKRDVSQKITINGLANELGVSPTLLKDVFKKTFGKPVCGWFRDYRMQHACEMLVDCPHLSIGQIAAEIGYSNPSKFSKAFANYYGVTPRAWRFAHTRPSEN